VRGQKAPAPERISEIQAALAKDGSFDGKPSGKWDASTVDAMKKFQEAHGLNPSGKLDAKTLQKLGLGSQTAGLAPPMPPVSSSSLAPSPSPTIRRQK
jgi:peptidoglycan hydrolase-like protein with peptidoglycan-binding domain